MPFANFTVGQVFFAVVHDHLRPPTEAFGKAMELFGEERAALEAYLALLQRCWATQIAQRPNFVEVRAAMLPLRLHACCRPFLQSALEEEVL